MEWLYLVFMVAFLVIFLFSGAVLAISPAWVRIAPRTAAITITAKCFGSNGWIPIACRVALLDAGEREISSKDTSLIKNVQTAVFSAPSVKSYLLLAIPNNPAYNKAMSRRIVNPANSLTVNLYLRKK